MMQWPECYSSDCESISTHEIKCVIEKSSQIFGSIEKHQDSMCYKWSDYFCHNCFEKIDKSGWKKK